MFTRQLECVIQVVAMITSMLNWVVPLALADCR